MEAAKPDTTNAPEKTPDSLSIINQRIAVIKKEVDNCAVNIYINEEKLKECKAKLQELYSMQEAFKSLEMSRSDGEN